MRIRDTCGNFLLNPEVRILTGCWYTYNHLDRPLLSCVCMWSEQVRLQAQQLRTRCTAKAIMM